MMKNVVASLFALSVIFLMVLLFAATESLSTIIICTIVSFVLAMSLLTFSRFSTNKYDF